jgi:hypothetical protein
MDRHAHPRHYSAFQDTMPPVDAYLDGGSKQDPTFNLLDTTYPTYLYDRFGVVSFSAPLENWPQFPYTTPRTQYPTMQYYNPQNIKTMSYRPVYNKFG